MWEHILPANSISYILSPQGKIISQGPMSSNSQGYQELNYIGGAHQVIRTVFTMAKVKSTLKPQSVKVHHPSSIPIVWSHSTVNHTNIFGYHFHFVDCAVVIENRFLFLLSSKDNSIGGLRNNTYINVRIIELTS